MIPDCDIVGPMEWIGLSESKAAFGNPLFAGGAEGGGPGVPAKREELQGKHGFTHTHLIMPALSL